jgi:hypothetical protein
MRSDQDFRAYIERPSAEANVMRKRTGAYYVKLVVPDDAASELSLEIRASSPSAAAQKAHSVWRSKGRLPSFGRRYLIDICGTSGRRLRQFERLNGAEIQIEPKGE